MQKPNIIYFSSVTENTKYFVDSLGFESKRIPLRKTDQEIHVNEPYILAIPTYGSGKLNGAVPKQVIHFLNKQENRNLCLGIIASGNINFGLDYCLAGYIIEEKLKVPLLYKFELRGMPGDKENVQKIVYETFKKYANHEIKTSNV